MALAPTARGGERLPALFAPAGFALAGAFLAGFFAALSFFPVAFAAPFFIAMACDSRTAPHGGQ